MRTSGTRFNCLRSVIGTLPQLAKNRRADINAKKKDRFILLVFFSLKMIDSCKWQAAFLVKYGMVGPVRAIASGMLVFYGK